MTQTSFATTPRDAVNDMRDRRRRGALRAVAAAAIAGAALGASPVLLAQYKYVGPDGRVTYTDRLPPADARQVTTLRRPAPPDPAASLPLELRMAARRNPVTLYTTRDCLPCQAAREHLERRGVPFAERMVNTAADMQRFQELGFRNSFPALGIGEQKVFGYQAAELDSMLDAAGYPASAVLPVAMRRVEPQPLAAEVVPVPRAEPSGEGSDALAGGSPQAQSGADGRTAQDGGIASTARTASPRGQLAQPNASTTGAPIRF